VGRKYEGIVKQSGMCEIPGVFAAGGRKMNSRSGTISLKKKKKGGRKRIGTNAACGDGAPATKTRFPLAGVTPKAHKERGDSTTWEDKR